MSSELARVGMVRQWRQLVSFPGWAHLIQHGIQSAACRRDPRIRWCRRSSFRPVNEGTTVATTPETLVIIKECLARQCSLRAFVCRGLE